QRWMQEGRLQAKKIEDSSLYEVETADLDRLRLRGHREEETRLQAVERKVTEVDERLDERIFQHEDQLAALEDKISTQAQQITLLEAARTTLTSQVEQLTAAQEKERRNREMLHAQLDELYRRFESLETSLSETQDLLHDIRVRLTHLEEQPTLTRTGPLVSAAEHRGTETHGLPRREPHTR